MELSEEQIKEYEELKAEKQAREKEEEEKKKMQEHKHLDYMASVYSKTNLALERAYGAEASRYKESIDKGYTSSTEKINKMAHMVIYKVLGESDANKEVIKNASGLGVLDSNSAVGLLYKQAEEALEKSKMGNDTGIFFDANKNNPMSAENLRSLVQDLHNSKTRVKAMQIAKAAELI